MITVYSFLKNFLKKTYKLPEICPFCFYCYYSMPFLTDPRLLVIRTHGLIPPEGRRPICRAAYLNLMASVLIPPLSNLRILRPGHCLIDQ